MRAALEENGEAGNGARFDPLSHKLVRRLLPEFLEEVRAAEARKAELESQLEATKKGGGEEDEEAEAAGEEEETLSEEEIKALKKELAEAKRKAQKLKGELDSRLAWRRAELRAEDCQRLALDIMQDDLAAQLERYVSAHRQQMIAAVENWWDKYRVTLRAIETERDAAASRLAAFMEGLGYVG